MRVFIANFGRENYEWPQCLERHSVATMNDESSHPYWVAGNREGFINYCMTNLKTAAGITPTRPVASRWFNLMTTIAETAGDIWIHREKDQIWWTKSRPDAPNIALKDEPAHLGGGRVYTCHKPCDPWSNYSRAGNRLQWNALHPRAKEFLFTEGTLQQLTEDNATYALAMINGDDLSPWHDRADWRKKAASARKQAGTIFNAKQRTVARMVMTAQDTAARSNGQQVSRVVKNKEVRFSQIEFEEYLAALLDAQEGLCAITGIRMQFDGEYDDAELLCSLDRIDSDGHYEPGNLQIVCRFINRWKSDGIDREFRRLIGLVRSSI